MKFRSLMVAVCLFVFLWPAAAQNRTQPSTQPPNSPPSGGAKDSGVRGGGAGAGGPISGISSSELSMFQAGSAQFQQVDSVSGGLAGTDNGLGPAFNLDSCGGCHA